MIPQSLLNGINSPFSFTSCKHRRRFNTGSVVRKERPRVESLKCISKPDSSLCLKRKSNARTQRFAVSFSSVTVDAPVESAVSVPEKLRRLVSEFASLSEPIDRVKRLLLYASDFSLFDGSVRVPENRVPGCATQVWVHVKIDEFGKMRFRADSDSEIAKGFCACLIWILDGAEPEEVMAVRVEELMDMNVGSHGTAKSRVNTWQNVLMRMQKRTKILFTESSPRFPSRFFGAESPELTDDESVRVITLYPPATYDVVHDYTI